MREWTWSRGQGCQDKSDERCKAMLATSKSTYTWSNGTNASESNHVAVSMALTVLMSLVQVCDVMLSNSGRFRGCYSPFTHRVARAAYLLPTHSVLSTQHIPLHPTMQLPIHADKLRRDLHHELSTSSQSSPSTKFQGSDHFHPVSLSRQYHDIHSLQHRHAISW